MHQKHAGEFYRCMADMDVAAARRLFAYAQPQAQQPATDEDMRRTLHMARTISERLPLKARAYSHRWLTERGLPSQLPDCLKPSAERLYPRVVEAVGIGIKARDPEMQPAADQVRRAMEGAVEDAYASGRTEPDFVRARMLEARTIERRRLFGSTGFMSLGAIK